jgi:hypothetical protein
MKGEEMKGEKKSAALMLAHLITTPGRIDNKLRMEALSRLNI